MITPTYAMTATERVLPRLAIDFTSGVADARVATTRSANTATRFNASGLIEIVNANLARFDFNPSTLVCRGQLIEEARTNLFLNSLIDGTNLSTQSVTLSAIAYTLSFYGSGSIAITGGHTATVAGTGDFPNRKTYTFTPTAGSSTFTVTGDVKFAQIEAGAFATSFIPTAGTSVLRNADAVAMTGTNFSSWFNASQGAFEAIYSSFAAVSSTSKAIMAVNDGTTSNRVYASLSSSARPTMLVTTLGSVQVNIQNDAVLASTRTKTAMAYKLDSFAMATNGGTVATDSLGSIRTVTRLEIGCFSSASNLNGYVEQLFYWPQRILNAETQAFSK